MKKIWVLVLTFALLFSCDFFGEEDKGNEDPVITLTTAQKEAAAETLMEDGQLDEALAAYDEIIILDDASMSASIRWSMLKLASISVHESVRTLAADLGVQDYPATINEAMGAENNMEPMSAIPTVTNTHMFTQFDNENETVSPLLALLYNIKNSYPDGFDPIMDGFINATSVMDEVIEEIDGLNDNASFTLTYDMIYPGQEYNPYYSSWPSAGYGQPAEIILGKAEVLVFASSLESVRAFAFAANSISMKVDLDGYWDIFNPLDGDFYEFDEYDEIIGVNENYDFNNFEDPIKYGLFETSEDASDALTQSREHFSNVFRFIKEAGDLIAARTDMDDFYISPATVGEEGWEIVADVNRSLGVVMDKVIDSIENSNTIYFPLPDEDEYVGDYILSLGDQNQWPSTAGDGVISINIGKIFEKPLFAIENIIELDNERGFVIYDITDEANPVVTDSFVDGNTYALKVVDNTFNGVIDENIASDIPNYIPLPALFAATELTPEGYTFTLYGIEIISEGSIFKLIKYIDEPIGEIIDEPVNNTDYSFEVDGLPYELTENDMNNVYYPIVTPNDPENIIESIGFKILDNGGANPGYNDWGYDYVNTYGFDSYGNLPDSASNYSNNYDYVDYIYIDLGQLEYLLDHGWWWGYNMKIQIRVRYENSFEITQSYDVNITH